MNEARSRSRLPRLIAGLVALLTVVALGAPAGAATASRHQEAGAPEAFTTLALINGWTNYGGGTGVAKVSLVNGIVRFKGAIGTSGTNDEPFVMPVGMRPSKVVYIPVDMCNATNGRLVINPDGTVQVDPEGDFTDTAACFTSLDGASFALAPAGQVNLALINGWTGGPFSTRSAGAAVIGGIVHLSGAISTSGTNKVPFVLPPNMRPAHTAFVPVDMCGASDGRLRIGHSGNVTVQADDSFSDAQCFTSLDGAHFAVNPAGQTALTLENGWTGAPFHTSQPQATKVAGVVHLTGAVSGGSSSQVFTLPTNLRPAKLVYLQVDLCGAANGRIYIDTDGTANVEAEGPFSDATCFTSLDGASFAR